MNHKVRLEKEEDASDFAENGLRLFIVIYYSLTVV